MDWKKWIFPAACGILVIGGLIFWLMNRPPKEEPMDAKTVYYTGPMKSKSLDSWGDAQGNPSDKSTADRQASEFQQRWNSQQPQGSSK